MKDILKLLVFLIGLFSYIIICLSIDTQQKYIFYIVVLYFAYNIIIVVDTIISKKKSPKVKKYSMKRVNNKVLKKLSF